MVFVAMTWRCVSKVLASVVVCLGVAFVFAWVAKPYIQRTIIAPFILAVVLSARAGGMPAGLLTAFCSIFLISRLFLGEGTGFVLIFEEIFALGVFSFIAIVVSRIVADARSANRRLRTLIEATSDGCWEWNIRSGHVAFSPKWISSLGYAAEELKPHVDTWKRLIHPDDVERTMATLQDHFKGRTPLYEVENRLLTKCGAWRWNRDRGKVIERDKHGEPLRMVGVDIDISDRKKAEDERAARMAAEAANSAKDHLIAIISHDLRGPLSAIATASQILRSLASLSETAVLALDLIDRSSRQQLLLINDLLDWSRIKSGKFDLNVSPVSLAQVIDSAWNAVAYTAEAKKIQWTKDVGSEVEYVQVDPDRLTQVLWNLLSNAVKFTPEGGTVTLSARYENGLCIQVSDTGAGIAKDALCNVFNPYWQSSSNDARLQGGLGLGLSIVRQIVERHGGSIEAASEGVGRGAQFTIHLPNAVPAALENRPVLDVVAANE